MNKTKILFFLSLIVVGCEPSYSGTLTDSSPVLVNETLATQSIDSKTPPLIAGKVPVDASVSSIALPPGAATGALQLLGNATLDSILDTLLNPLAVTQSGTWNVGVIGPVPLPTGAATETTLSTLNSKVITVNTGSVIVSSSALPAGAATSAMQTTGNTSLSTIASNTTGVSTAANQSATNAKLDDIYTYIQFIDADTSYIAANTPVLGQTVMAASTPVAIANNQSPVPVSGTGTFTVVQPTGSNLHVVTDSTSTTIATQNTATNLKTQAEMYQSGNAVSNLNPLNVIAAANSGVDIGDVTINNTSGGGAVNVQDGGNSITVDNAGTFATQSSQSGTWTVQPGNTANTTAWKVDGSAVIQPVSGTVTANQGGNWTTRVVGNAGAIFDAPENSAAPANILLAGAQLQSGASATQGTAGQVGSVVAGLDHVLYSRFGGPVTWSCFRNGITVTTECRAAPAAGLRLYVTSMMCSNQATTVQTLDIVHGTGVNCATGITALTHKVQFDTVPPATSPQNITQTFVSPLVPPAANAICIRPSAATAFGCTLTGYTAP